MKKPKNAYIAYAIQIANRIAPRSSEYYACLFNLINELELSKTSAFHDVRRKLRNGLVHGYFIVDPAQLKDFIQGNAINNDSLIASHALYKALEGYGASNSAATKRVESFLYKPVPGINAIDEAKKSYIQDIQIFLQGLVAFLHKPGELQQLDYEASLCCVGLFVEAINELKISSPGFLSELVGKIKNIPSFQALLNMTSDRNAIFHDEEKPEKSQLKKIYTKENLTELLGIINQMLTPIETKLPSKEQLDETRSEIAKMLEEARAKKSAITPPSAALAPIEKKTEEKSIILDSLPLTSQEESAKRKLSSESTETEKKSKAEKEQPTPASVAKDSSNSPRFT